jgi:exopolyphosphatase
VDHHVEEGILPKDCGDEPRVVKKSGSCSTLVVEYCREAWDKLPKTGDKEVSAWNSELARLALAPILIDTANFTMESVVTPADAEIAEYLESMITPEPGRSYKRKEYFQEVFDAKQDISRLSLYDILRKDYKQWDDSKTINLGISSVVKGFQFLLEKAGSKEKLNSEMEKFAEERGLSLFSVLTVLDQHNKLKRELLVLAMNEKGVDAVKRFESTGKDHLGLEAWGDKQLDIDGENQSRRCWQQERTQNGRKQVAPLLREAIGQV